MQHLQPLKKTTSLATENTREAIFDAMLRKEVYGTTGTRMSVRMFGGWELTDQDLASRIPANAGYKKGTLMGGDLLHFIAIGGLFFLIYTAVNDTYGNSTDTIFVTPERISQIRAGINGVWNRMPTSEELGNLIDEEIRSEVYYRDALALGLDKNDAIVRRQLRQKMEFLTDTGIYLKEPSAGELVSGSSSFAYFQSLQRGVASLVASICRKWRDSRLCHHISSAVPQPSGLYSGWLTFEGYFSLVRKLELFSFYILR